MIRFPTLQAATANKHSSIGQDYGPGMVYSGSEMASHLSPRLRLQRVYSRDWLPSFIVERVAHGFGKHTVVTHRGHLFRFQTCARFYFTMLYFECVAGCFLPVLAKAGSFGKRFRSRGLFLLRRQRRRRPNIRE